jgi:hypothetical protein
MADEKPIPDKPKKIHRVRIGVNVIVQVALLLFLAIMSNYLGFEHYRRWDLSRDQKYALSDKTKRFLATIKDKMRITVFFSADNLLSQDVQSLLIEYQYAARGKIDIEYVDPYRSPSRGQAVVDKYKILNNESQLILDYDNRNKSVKGSEIAEIDQSGEFARITAFKGEQAITSAMIDLVEGKKNVIGYVLGHGEPPILDTEPTLTPSMVPDQGTRSPIGLVRTEIENENIKFQELKLLEVSEISADLKTVVIAGPQYDFSDREMKLLRDFWDKQGRILLLLDPSAKTPKLNGFLNELGVKVNDDRLMAKIQSGIEEVALVRDVIGHFLAGSPITKRLAEVRAQFMGGTCSLTLEPERVRAANIVLQSLIQAEKGGGNILPPGYWGETDYNSDDPAALQFDPNRDHAPPANIAVTVEKGGSADDRVQANSARMVVTSNAFFIQDDAITQGQQALNFMSGSINWLLSREQLIGIAPKVPKTLTFNLDDNAMRNLRWLILVLLPLVPAVLGLGVWWYRRA